MALDTKTFTVNSGWTFTGAVALSGTEALLSAVIDYEASSSGSATLDLTTLNDGDALPGWTIKAGTATKETDGGTAVIETGGTWGLVYVTGSSLENCAIKTLLGATSGRWNSLSRWPVSVQGGYVAQLEAAKTLMSGEIPATGQGFNDATVNIVRFNNGGTSTDPAPGDSIIFNNFTLADGDVINTLYFASLKVGEKVDAERKEPAGVYGIQSFLTAKVESFIAYSLASGTAEETFTPDSVTSWVSISAILEGLALVMQTCKFSDVLEYKMEGVGASPAVFTAVPNDGDISGAVGTGITIKLTIDNRFRMDSTASLHGLAIEINGAWDPAVGPTVPDEPTGLTLVSQSATDVSLSWTNGANTDSLEIMRAEISSAGVTGQFDKINDGVVTGTTYTDNAANSTPDPVEGRSYAYAIKPLNSITAGDWSNTVTATFVTAVTRIPGDFEGDLPSEFLQTSDFAEDVIYTAFGGSPTTIKAMYDAESTEVDPGSGDIRSSNPMVTVATKDVESASNRDTFTISGQVFRVREVMPDGTGLTVIVLTKDA